MLRQFVAFDLTRKYNKLTLYDIRYKGEAFL